MKKSIGKLGLIILLLTSLFLIYFYFFRTVGKGTIPVINYHSISDNNPNNNEYIVKTDKFEEMIKSLSDQDFTFLSMQDVEDIIYKGKKLPKNPILITFDDGYKDNYSNAYPILKKYKAHASIFLIGSYVGQDKYLSWDNVIEMSESGLIDFGNHSYNLHDRFLEGPNKGKTYLSVKLDNESEEEYFQKIKNDLIWNNSLIYQSSSNFPSSIAYPGSMINESIIKATKEAGIKIGFIGGNKFASKLENIDPYKIKRFHISPDINISNMVRFLKSNN